MIKRSEPTLIIYTNNRSRTLYIVSLLTFLLSVFVFYMIFSDLNDFYEEYSSKLSGTIWMIFMIIMGNLMLLCMLWLNGRYVLKIENAEKEFIKIKTWSIFGFHKTKTHPNSILNNIKYYEGYTHINGTPTVNAPWFKLKTTKGKMLIIDAQGDFNKQLKTRNLNNKI